MHPIYRSDGQVIAVVHQGNLYNVDGDWLGCLQGAEVFGFEGEYLGTLSEDRRLLRSRRPGQRERIPRPEPAPRLRGIPEMFPLAPLFSQLPYGVVDVFEEYPHLFDFVGETRQDLD